jgi:8-amino-7-oxononanoate synthase
MGRGASRLLGGNDDAHVQLEELLARWLGVDQALLFSSGYAANVGMLAALIERNDWVVSDALNHASIIDGLRLTRARVVVVPHLDAAAVAEALRRREGRRAWVVTESYFSMDADTPDLKQLRLVCDEHQAALVVDEAHAMGVFGPDGRGLCAAAGITPDVCVGTLGKAFGAAGAFVAGCDVLIDWLWNRARSHVFSTAMSPNVAAAARTNVKHATSHPSLRERAMRHGARFREAMRQAGADVRGHGPIVPWVLGTEELALRTAEELQRRQVYVIAIRPPTVPENTSRIRFAFNARHTESDVDQATDAARAALACLHR